MSCVAQLQCHVKVKGNDVYLLGTGVIKFKVTYAFFQLLKGLFLSFINSLRFNGYKVFNYTIFAYGRAVFFFSRVISLMLQNWRICAFEDKGKRKLMLNTVYKERLLGDLFCRQFTSQN